MSRFRRPPTRVSPEACASAGGLLFAAGLEPCDELVEPQLLESATHRVELGGTELAQRAALLEEGERLAQAGVAGVQAADDLLEPRDGRLVGALGGAHSSILARTESSLNVTRTRP